MKSVTRIIFALCMLALLSFRPASNNAGQLSTLIFKLQYSSAASKGFGGSVRIQDMATGKEYVGQSGAGFNSFVVIKDVPPGRYQVKELEVITGTIPQKISGPRTFSNILVDSTMTYYLGSYRVKKTGPIGSRDYKVVRRDADKASRIRKQLQKSGDAYAALPIEFGQQLFIADVAEVKYVNTTNN